MASFTFYSTIPAANNNPSQDQPKMLQNNDSTNQILAVDHVSFNTDNGGTHKQVTFSSNNAPSGYTFPVLFTNTQDGAGNTLPSSFPEAFFYTGSDTASKNQYVSAATGSVLLLGGIILKWGTFVNTDPNPHNFGVAFPNNCFAVTTDSGIVTAKTTTGFSVSTAANGTRYYIAIGN